MVNSNLKIKKNPDILFLFPNYEGWGFSDFSLSYNLGVGYIQAYLKKRGISNLAQYLNKEPISLDKLINQIINLQPKIVGLSCFDSNYYFVKVISRELKRKAPYIKIMAGGPTATFSDSLVMKDIGAIDICVRGEAEETVYELINNLSEKKKIDGIRGLTYWHGKRLVRTPDRSLIRGDDKKAELDIVPSPFLEGDAAVADLDRVGILTSRGCIYKCIYCNFSAMSRWTLRFHSIDRVIQELKVIEKTNNKAPANIWYRTVEIYDDGFSSDLKRAKEICRRIIKEKINLHFIAQMRADMVDKELIYLMKDASFVQLSFGLESAVPRVLREIKKLRTNCHASSNLNTEKRFLRRLKDNVNISHKIGLNTGVSVIVGLPIETEKDAKKTIDFVRNLKVNYYYHNKLSVFAGTELFKKRKDYGIGIKRSLTVLPYVVKHAYNLAKVPELENSFQRLLRRMRVEEIMRLFSGDFKGSNERYFSEILIGEDLRLDNNLINGLKSLTALYSLVGFYMHDSNDQITTKNLNLMRSSDFPTMNLFVLRKNKKIDKSNIAEYKLNIIFTHLFRNNLSLEYQPRYLLFRPFSNYSTNGLKFDKERTKPIFSFNTLQDIEKMIEFVQKPGRIVLTGEAINFDVYFQDECRWQTFACPALKFKRGILRNRDEIIPCFNGCTIGNIGGSQRELERNIDKLKEKIQRKRGCKTCPVRNCCSKCLFPHPLSDTDYCNLRRKYPQINMVFELFKIMRKIRTFFSTSCHRNLREITGTFDFENSLVMVKADNGKYVYDIGANNVFRADIK